MINIIPKAVNILCLTRKSNKIPIVVQKIVAIHQVCLSTTVTLIVPGSSGGRPTAGASWKIKKPHTPVYLESTVTQKGLI